MCILYVKLALKKHAPLCAFICTVLSESDGSNNYYTYVTFVAQRKKEKPKAQHSGRNKCQKRRPL